MNSRLMAVIIVLLISVGIAYSGLKFQQISKTQSELNEISRNSNLQKCRDIRENICMTNGQITKSSYPESCFRNGDNIIKKAYQCP